jgi:hypothetical protein
MYPVKNNMTHKIKSEYTKLRINMKFRRIALLSVFAFVLLSSLLMGTANAQSFGSPTNFEGPKGSFYGVQYQGNWGAPLRWSNWETPGTNPTASLHDFSTVLKFDSDGRDSGKPNIYGEMTSIYLPANTVGQITSWTPPSWLNQLEYLQNPIGNYTWQIDGKYYGMQSWLCRWYLGFSAEWEGGLRDLPIGGGGFGEAPPQNAYADGDNSYNNLELWLKIDTSPTFYYENADRTYFGIGKVQLKNDIEYTGQTNQYGGLLSSNKVDPRTTVSVVPESQASILYLYDAPWGDAGSTKVTSYSYQGQALNPDIFKDETYVKVDFNRFGVYGGFGWGIPFYIPTNFWCRGDTAVICLEVTVFSIGEWKVQDVQNDPDHYGRFTRTDQSTDIISWITANYYWILPLLIFIVVLIFAPGILFTLVQLVRS